MKRPLMPKATAIWLIENTTLSFEQIAEFCGMHKLEIQGIADGDVGSGMRGLDPVVSGQLDWEEIDRCAADPKARLGIKPSQNPDPVEGLNQDNTITVTGSDTSNPKKAEIKLWANYINLDTDERKRFAQEHHEYLIEQVQYIKKEYKPYMDINLNHPVKCLYWVIQNDIALQSKEDYKLIDNIKNTYGVEGNSIQQNTWKNGNDYLNYKIHEPINPSHLNGITVYEHFKTMKLTFNGIDRFKARDATFFRTLQPLENKYTIPTKNIYMYSFCLDPEDYKPSGSCNFSRIDNFTVSFTGEQPYEGYQIYLYAKNYNVLRIMEGMGGLLYSN